MRNIVDSIYRTFAPVKALKRERARLDLKIMETVNSGYDAGGASWRKNSMKGWAAYSSSPQQDIDENLHTLRQRSRELYMTSPVATSAIVTNRTNVVGQGLVVKPSVDYKTLGLRKEEAEVLNRQIKREFSLWAESKQCDSMRLNNFAELQQIAMISWLLNGDCFATLQYKSVPQFPYELKIRLIEADRVSNPDSMPGYINRELKAINGNRIFNGVEIDDYGEIVAYYISDYYPGDYIKTNHWSRVEAFGKTKGNPNVIHIMCGERPEQYRGVPYLAPVIETIKQLTRYTDAEIMAAVINGLFAVFVKTEEGEDNIDFEGVEEERDILTPENNIAHMKQQPENELKLGNGMINYLKEGESIEIADAKRPNVNFDAFVTSFLSYIGAALEIPVELLTKRFTASYSASKGALLEAWKAFRMRRSWFTDDFCQPIYEIWLAEAVAKGRIQAPGFFLDPFIRKCYCKASWNGPAPGHLDPVKEAQAAELRVKGGFSTRTSEAIEMNGSDFNENVELLHEENKKLFEANIEEKEVTGGNN